MQDNNDHILTTWHQNARPWINAIANQEIESRKLVTNQAVVDSIMLQGPENVWDIGCGEGWLCRALQHFQVSTFGTDAIPELIYAARKSGGNFEVADYEAIINGQFIPQNNFDLIAFNFSLFGNEQVAALLKAVRQFIAPGGHLLIQTLHPLLACGDAPYTDGWRSGSWQGFSPDFINPAPWYFRTLENWITTINAAGYTIVLVKEPLHPENQKPVSVIFTASLSA